eukprot:764074-Hanusia_phi.AAC.6
MVHGPHPIYVPPVYCVISDLCTILKVPRITADHNITPTAIEVLEGAAVARVLLRSGLHWAKLEISC